MRKNLGRQIRTYSQRLDEYFDGVLKGEQPLKPLNEGKTYFNATVAPLSSLKPTARLTTLVPSWMLDEALAAGMTTLTVCFVPETDYKYFAKRVAMLRKPKQKTLFVVKLKPETRRRNGNH